MLAYATNLFATGTNALGRLPDKWAYIINSLSYHESKVFDFMQILIVSGEKFFKRLNPPYICGFIPER
jgi:hypothetical protein